VGSPVSANALAGDLLPGDKGTRLENLVACALLKEIHRLQDVDGENFDLHYSRNKEGQEIDFLVSRKSRPVKLIEVKWKDASLSPSFSKLLAGEPISRLQVVGELEQNKSYPGGERIEAAVDFLAGVSIAA